MSPQGMTTVANKLDLRPGGTYHYGLRTPDGFEIWRQLWNGEWALMATVPNVGSYTDTTSIEPNKSYVYQVRAYKGTDESQFSNVKGVTTPAYSGSDGTCP